MNFIHQKTNKEKLLNFVLRLGRSWRTNKAPKFSFKISNEHFNLSEAEISLKSLNLDEIIKFRNK